MRKVVKFIQKVLKPKKHQSIIIPRDQHKISRSRISKSALKVLYRLHKSGYSAYLVGGSVRDLLLGLKPKDFDVVTDAHPEEIHKLFRNSFIIGRRFRLVHVRFGQEIVEVATFRGKSAEHKTPHGLLLSDNVYGTLDDDIWRRDFTVNAFYYNIADFTVVDYAQGMEDLKRKHLRVIGDPVKRYREDPARMLRAIRIAAKLDFVIEPKSAEPIKQYKSLLLQIPPARLFDKMLKIFHSGKSVVTFRLMEEYGVFSILFPQVKSDQKDFIYGALENSDIRVAKDKPINSAFLFAVLMWGALQLKKEEYLAQEGMSEHQAFHLAVGEVIQKQLKIISIPKKLTLTIREVWYLQHHLEHGRPSRIYKTFTHPRFRAAFDFFLLRSQFENHELESIANWWLEFQESDEETRGTLITSRFSQAKGRKRRKRGKRNASSIPSVGQ